MGVASGCGEQRTSLKSARASRVNYVNTNDTSQCTAWENKETNRLHGRIYICMMQKVAN